MDKTRRLIVQYPSEQQIVRINRIQLEIKGGLPFAPPSNFREGAPSLNLILDTISEPIYGTEMYIGVYHKAAALAHKIIVGHVFNDANKRTGTMAALALLNLNRRPIQVSSSELVDMAVLIGRGECTVEELGVWFFRRAVPP